MQLIESVKFVYLVLFAGIVTAGLWDNVVNNYPRWLIGLSILCDVAVFLLAIGPPFSLWAPVWANAGLILVAVVASSLQVRNDIVTIRSREDFSGRRLWLVLITSVLIEAPAYALAVWNISRQPAQS